MDKPMRNSYFIFMSLAFMFRDLFIPRRKVLNELDIKEGDNILDYGCGPGSYSVITAGMVGPKGKVYALDIHPMAIQKVRDIVAKKKLVNIEIIQSNNATGLDNDSMDIVLFYDIFHLLSDPTRVLKELHRVLKPGGFLAFSDHHMKEDGIKSGMTEEGLFKLVKKGRRSYIFGKASR